VKHALTALFVACCVGCLQPNPKGGDSTSPAAGAVSVQKFGEGLAVWVSGEHCEDTDEFWRCAKQSAEDLGLSATVLDQLGTVDANRDFDAALRAEFAAKCRSLK
jgi:hypothetical protein